MGEVLLTEREIAAAGVTTAALREPFRPDRIDTGWIDGFVREIRREIAVRDTDGLLIVLPNQCYRINRSGAALLKAVLGGAGIERVIRRIGDSPRTREAVFYFFADLAALISNDVPEPQRRFAIERRPFRRPFNTLPVLSEIALTYRCNLKCGFCYASCGCRQGSADEMTTGEVLSVLKKIKSEAQVPSVSFSGGEPTLRRDLLKLIGGATRLGLRVNLITNGTLIDAAFARRLARSGLASAQVSIEATDSEIHDRLVGQTGAFAASVAAVRALQSAGVFVHTNTTLNRLNFDNAVSLPAFVKGLGLSRFSMNFMIPGGLEGVVGAKLRVKYSELPKKIEELRLAGRAAGVRFLWYAPIPHCIYNPVRHGLGNKSCAACDGLLAVNPSGDVLPCSSHPEIIGSLLRHPFAAIWNAERAVHFREKKYMPAECDGCGQAALCQGACPLYFGVVGTGELTEAQNA